MSSKKGSGFITRNDTSNRDAEEVKLIHHSSSGSSSDASSKSVDRSSTSTETEPKPSTSSQKTEKARRQKIFDHCFGSCDSLKFTMFHENHHFQHMNQEEEGSCNSFEPGEPRKDESSFQFPHKPIEVEALRLEEVEQEQRVNKRRKANSIVADGDVENRIHDCDDLESESSSCRKSTPIFQRVVVGEQSAAGVCYYFSLRFTYTCHLSVCSSVQI